MKTNFETQKQAYIELINICLPNKADQITPFFDTVNDGIKNDSFELLFGLIDYINSATTAIFIMEFDKNTKPSTFGQQIMYSVLLNFNKPVVLPKYSDDFTLNHTKNLYENYNVTLSKIGLSLGYIDTMSDSAVVFVHQTKDLKKVKEIFNILELKYIELIKPNRKRELAKDEKNLPANYIHIGKGVLGVRFHMTAKEVIKIMGQPDDNDYKEKREDSFHLTYKNKGIALSFMGRIAKKDDILTGIFLYSGVAGGYEDGSFSKFSGTGKSGFTLDSKFDEIIKIFGNTNDIFEDPFGNSPTKLVQYPKISFTFKQETDELVYITLGH